jgi:outer membrane protein, multidrug efflux system
VKFLLLSMLVFSNEAFPESLQLDQLVERARANDFRVKESESQLRFFKAKYEEARWAWFPKVDSYALLAGPTPEARNDGLGGPPSTEASLMYDTNFGTPGVMFRAGAEGLLPLYTFGKFDALKEGGRNLVIAGEHLKTRAQDEAELQVSQAYYGYCLAKTGEDVLQETKQRLEDAKTMLLKLQKEGSDQVAQVDLFKLDFYQQQLEVQRANAQAGANFALAAIRLLINAKPGELISPTVQKLNDIEGSLLPREVYSKMALENRPELLALEAGLRAREQEVLLKELMYYPDFGLAGFIRVAATTSATRQISPFAYDPYHELTGGFALAIRYQWDFPQKSIALEQSRAELEKMEHQRDLLKGAVNLEIEKTWGDVTAALSKAGSQSQAEKSARRWATSAFAAFDLGTGDTRELVDSFSALALSSSQKIQAIHDAKVGLKLMSRSIGKPIELVTVAPSGLPLLVPK